jgi:hypothetical protein
MSSAGLTTLFVSLGVGIPVFVAAILILVFSLVGRARARERAAFDHEGVVLDSGRLWITIRYANFRAPRIYRGVGIAKTRGSLVLTRQRFGVLTGGYQRPYSLIARSDLGRFTVGIAEDGALQIHSDDPPGATGSIDYRIALGDAASWVKALTEAGARRRAS